MQDIYIYKNRLEKILEDYRNLLESYNSGLGNSMTDSIAELALYDNHPGDIASEVFERGKDVGVHNYLEKQIEKVEDALAKIEKGNYGYCDKCGQPIDEERLEVIPFTTMCVKCREKDEGDYNSYDIKARRPIEEQVIMPPFGGKTNNPLSKKLDSVEFDGEDAWQAAARYGTSESPSDIGNVLDYNNIYPDYDEDVGTVEEYEKIPVYKDKDGQYYEDFDGSDDDK